MNAIIALCHFCELHGPRILFCTQPIRQAGDDGDVSDSGSTAISQDRRVCSPTNTSGAEYSSGSSSLPAKVDTCEACHSIHTGFMSRDDEALVHYVSAQYPHQSEVFTVVRQACVRSLSCEVCPGREGPIFFGDEQHGYVISYTFYVSDSQARGFQRWYSILVIMMDKVYLLNSWPFLVPNLRAVIDKLQSKAQCVHDEEQARCPQRALRLTTSMTPANFRQQRGINKPARSLIELTDDRHLFRLLHVAFVWILKACGNRITETLLEGPPTEDSIIDMEKQEGDTSIRMIEINWETEEGFIKLYTKKIGDDTSLCDEMLGETEECLSYQTEDLDEPEESAIKNLRLLLQAIGAQRFHTVAHHIVIGNQIIVRCAKRSVIKAVLNAFKMLLPRGCCRIIPYSNNYVESWRCNFLGVPPAMCLSNHVVSAEMFLLVDIRDVEGTASESISEFDFRKYIFKLQTSSTLTDKAPSVQTKMEHALGNNNLADCVVLQCFICLKEEWMNKVKVLFKFTKAGGSRSEEDTRRLLQVVGAREEDKQLLKFWMTGLSVQYKTHILSFPSAKIGQKFGSSAPD